MNTEREHRFLLPDCSVTKRCLVSAARESRPLTRPDTNSSSPCGLDVEISTVHYRAGTHDRSQNARNAMLTYTANE